MTVTGCLLVALSILSILSIIIAWDIGPLTSWCYLIHPVSVVGALKPNVTLCDQGRLMPTCPVSTTGGLHTVQ